MMSYGFVENGNDEDSMDRIYSTVHEVVEPFIQAEMDEIFQPWFQSSQAEHYYNEIEDFTKWWVEDIVRVVAEAEISGTGDVTSLDYNNYPREIASFLFKIRGDILSEQDIYHALKDMEERILEPAFNAVVEEQAQFVRKQTDQERSPFETSASSYRGRKAMKHNTPNFSDKKPNQDKLLEDIRWSQKSIKLLKRNDNPDEWEILRDEEEYLEELQEMYDIYYGDVEL